MRYLHVFSVIVGGLIGISPGLAGAAVMFQQGVGGYTGTQDTELRQDNPAANFGNAPTLTIDLADPNDNTQGLLRFDSIFGPGPGQIPLGATILSANLQLYIVSGGNNIDMMQMLLDWTENTATWNDLGSDGDGVSNPGEASFLRTLVGRPTAGSPLYDSGTTQIFDVGTEVQNWAGGADNFGWAFLPTGNDGVDFATSENSTIGLRPMLSVNFRVTSVPEPGTLALFGIGLAGLGFMRRKRAI